MKKYLIAPECLELAREVCEPGASYKKNTAGQKMPERSVSESMQEYFLEEGEASVFLNPLTDAGFKILFGDSGELCTEANMEDKSVLKKGDLLKEMLNSFFGQRIPAITKVQFKNVEAHGATIHDRKVVYDLYFSDGSKREFIVEMQNQKISFLLNRMHNYMSRAHSSVMEKGASFDHNQAPLVGVLIANCIIHQDRRIPCISVTEYGDMETGVVTMHLSKIMTVELPKFTKRLDELIDKKDVFLFLLRNLGRLKKIPPQLDTDLFRPLFEYAEIANLKKEEIMLINEERTWERKRQLEMETALQENTEMVTELVTEQVTERVKEQVSEQNTRSFIESLILDGSMTEGQIARITKVSVDFVQRLKKGLAFG